MQYESEMPNTKSSKPRNDRADESRSLYRRLKAVVDIASTSQHLFLQRTIHAHLQDVANHISRPTPASSMGPRLRAATPSQIEKYIHYKPSRLL